ncbi:hypothetical protein D8M04_19615 [Oceanobacillus piezotolerans]|uniref:Uncharacterized protein n=1 Tax=Oceanobacillus piezotolerans TaxID=2448030 RepID=A0A498D446_9BACI|nr:hypothetical protein D8M04_19615 [Oceanobacillus piezotolerans]
MKKLDKLQGAGSSLRKCIEEVMIKKGHRATLQGDQKTRQGIMPCLSYHFSGWLTNQITCFVVYSSFIYRITYRN